jgi:hypothetical protein
MDSNVRFGFHLPNHTFPGAPPEAEFARMVELATTAEGVGFDLLTVMDHFYQIENIGLETEPILEGYVALAAVAARTSRIRLGTLVTGVTYRNPALLAKMVTTLDVVSGGRAGGIRHRRRVAREGARRVRVRVPADPRTDVPARGGVHHRPAHVHRGSTVVRGAVLPDRSGAQLAAAADGGRTTDHGRRGR